MSPGWGGSVAVTAEECPALRVPKGRAPAELIPAASFHKVSLWCKHSWGRRRENLIFQPFVVAFTPTAPSALSAYTPERVITVFYVEQ